MTQTLTQAPPPGPAEAGSPSGPPPGRFARFASRIWTAPSFLAPLFLLSCFGAAAGLVLATNPTDTQPDQLGPCALKTLTGYDCPGCGGTRAFWYLLHANLPEAARHHLVAVFAAPFVVYAYLGWTLQRIAPNSRLRLPALRVTPVAISLFLTGWAVFAILRNLPWAPFTFLYV